MHFFTRRKCNLRFTRQGPIDLAPVVQRMDNAIHWTNHCPVDSVVCVSNTYPLDSHLFGGKRYPPLEQPGPGFNFQFTYKGLHLAQALGPGRMIT